MNRDSATERSAGKTLAAWRARLDRVNSHEQFMTAWLDLQSHGVNAVITYAAQPDPSDAAHFRGVFLQGNLGQRRLAYSEKSPQADALRLRYREHVARMFELAGTPKARAAQGAEAVLRLESTLASASLPYFDQFDPKTGEHPVTPAELSVLAPHVDWTRFLKMAGQRPDRMLNVASSDYLRSVDALIANTPVADLRAFLTWQFMNTFPTALPDRLAREEQGFASRGLKASPRFAQCRLETMKNLGLELSRQFSLRYVGSKTRSAAKEIAAHVQDEVVKSTTAFTWLTPAARAATEQKVRLLDLKVAYPDNWPETGSFPLSRHAFLDNVFAAQEYEQHREWKRVNEERRHDSWEATVYPNEAAGMAAARLVIPNGFPDQTTNSIILTAASLRPPQFDAEAPAEVRYGTFGFLVGHELGHIIENHDYDAFGRPVDAWSPEDVRMYDQQRACVVKQANEYVAFDDVHLDGDKTEGENFGDLSGVYHAYLAMARELGAHISDKGDDGLTPSQRFFIAYAQQWCSVEGPDSMRESIRDDGHAPARYRTNAPLSNMPAFAHAFSCPSGSPMVRPESTRCSLWGLAFPAR
jgi:predicted metalloendopeptidase